MKITKMFGGCVLVLIFSLYTDFFLFQLSLNRLKIVHSDHCVRAVTVDETVVTREQVSDRDDVA